MPNRPARYQISRSKDGRAYIELIGGNNESMWTSQMYPHKAAAEEGLHSIKAASREAQAEQVRDYFPDVRKKITDKGLKQLRFKKNLEGKWINPELKHSYLVLKGKQWVVGGHGLTEEHVSTLADIIHYFQREYKTNI